MSEPFVGEIRMFPYTFYPENWADCNGQTLQIAQQQVLFAVIGTYFGGNGSTTFCLPDLRGRTPVHPDSSQGVQLGTAWGLETVHIDLNTMPSHSHSLMADTAPAGSNLPSGNVVAQTEAAFYETVRTDMISMDHNSISMVGGNGYHNNIQPSLGMRFCIALDGMFPSRN